MRNLEDFIFGRKVILTALENNVEINKIYLAKGSQGAIIDDIVNLCKKKRVIFNFLDRRELDHKFGENHQGVVAYINKQKYLEIEEFISRKKTSKNLKITILDNITDPHNTGAIIRSAYAFGFDAVCIPTRHSCLVNSTVSKVSSGASNLIPIIKITNIVSTIKFLKKNNFWIIGADINGENLNDLNLKKQNICLVLGSEGEGIKKLVRENCDFLAKIPMKNNFDSINVSCAAAVFFYEFSKI